MLLDAVIGGGLFLFVVTCLWAFCRLIEHFTLRRLVREELARRGAAGYDEGFTSPRPKEPPT